MAKRDVPYRIADEIVEIVEERDRQEAAGMWGGTPGGLEHMGDVWSLLSRWRDEIKSA